MGRKEDRSVFWPLLPLAAAMLLVSVSVGASFATPNGSVTAVPVEDGECALGCDRFIVTSRDRTRLSVQEWGNPGGPPILFIHGFSQSHLSWVNQVTDDALAALFRLVTFDLRGHGESDQPLDPKKYTEARLWAEDVDAVIDQMNLESPVLVGHSLGSTIIADYLARFGDEEIGGINFVGGFVILEDVSFNFLGEGFLEILPLVGSTDIFTNINGTKQFNRLLTKRKLPAEDAVDLLAYNMMVPPEIRNALISTRAAVGGFIDHQEALESTTVPVLITHGIEDAIILVEIGLAVESVLNGPNGNGNSILALYRGIGHTPPVENPMRFNQELIQLVERADN